MKAEGLTHNTARNEGVQHATFGMDLDKAVDGMLALRDCGIR